MYFRGVPNLVARKLDLEQALASTGSMGEIAVKHREQLDWLKESGAADDGAAEAGGGGPAGSVQWSGRSSQATTKKGWGAIGGGGSLSLKAKTEMLAAKKDSNRIRALEELVGDGTTLEEEAASGELSPFDLRPRQCLVLTAVARGQACNAVVCTADVVHTWFTRSECIQFTDRSQACQVQRVFLRPGTRRLLLRRHGLDVRNTEGAEGVPQASRELRPGIGRDELRGLVASLARLPRRSHAGTVRIA